MTVLCSGIFLLPQTDVFTRDPWIRWRIQELARNPKGVGKHLSAKKKKQLKNSLKDVCPAFQPVIRTASAQRPI